MEILSLRSYTKSTKKSFLIPRIAGVRDLVAPAVRNRKSVYLGLQVIFGLDMERTGKQGRDGEHIVQVCPSPISLVFSFSSSLSLYSECS
jgi:hypothetical protein